jgi:hypothetical protein
MEARETTKPWMCNSRSSLHSNNLTTVADIIIVGKHMCASEIGGVITSVLLHEAESIKSVVLSRSRPTISPASLMPVAQLSKASGGSRGS